MMEIFTKYFINEKSHMSKVSCVYEDAVASYWRDLLKQALMQVCKTTYKLERSESRFSHLCV